MKTDEEIIFEYHYQNQLKQYDKIKDALAKRDFDYLLTHGHPYATAKEKNIIISEKEITAVIEGLTKINNAREPNESPISVISEIKEGVQYTYGVEHPYTEESYIVASSLIYTMRPVEQCEKIATNYTKHDLWKLKHQSDGIDAKRMRKLIERIRLTDEA